jgi:hypothetical protein
MRRRLGQAQRDPNNSRHNLEHVGSHKGARPNLRRMNPRTRRNPNRHGVFGLIATPHGNRPTGTDFSGLNVSTSTTVMSFVRPFAT